MLDQRYADRQSAESRQAADLSRLRPSCLGIFTSLKARSVQQATFTAAAGLSDFPIIWLDACMC